MSPLDPRTTAEGRGARRDEMAPWSPSTARSVRGPRRMDRAPMPRRPRGSCPRDRGDRQECSSSYGYSYPTAQSHDGDSDLRTTKTAIPRVSGKDESIPFDAGGDPISSTQAPPDEEARVGGADLSVGDVVFVPDDGGISHDGSPGEPLPGHSRAAAITPPQEIKERAPSTSCSSCLEAFGSPPLDEEESLSDDASVLTAGRSVYIIKMIPGRKRMT